MNTNTLDDKVLWKRADELPTYHLANIVDDHLMEITEVIRGEEWLPSLPLHYMLYKAFGWTDTQPRFAHLSLLLKPDGKGKLSKRDGDRLGFPVFPLEWISATGEVSRGYREDGYYPEAFVNLIALLGWNPGTEQEIFSLEEFVKCFSLDRVVKSGARFNPDKAKWFNQEYLRKRSNNELAQEFLPVLAKNGIENIDVALVEKIIASVKDRAHFVSDFWELTNFFFVRPTEYDATSVKKFWKEEIIPSVKEISDMIVTIAPFEKEVIEERIHTFITDGGLPMGKIMNALRLAIVGASKGPGVADIIALIGAEEFRTRIDNALSTISR
jgi:glutamyl-tRNA synthetase